MISVPSKASTLNFSIGSKISGKCSNPEKERFRSQRDFSLQILVGRLLIPWQPLNSKRSRLERRSIDEGTHFIEVKLRTRFFTVLGSVGNSLRDEQKPRLGYVSSLRC